MPVAPDIYDDGVDFALLANQYPDFAKKLKPNRQLDFSDPDSIIQLTKALLDRDFQLKIDLPSDRLCPPVPNRFNYVNYVQRLLECTQEDYSDKHDPSKQVIGLDIGTGASAIYPLLAAHQNPAWVFLATEIDEKSKEYAVKNIAANNLSSRIKIIGNPARDNDIIPWNELVNIGHTDFLMTNPPFYESEAEMLNLAGKKSRPPNSTCTGAPVEMICPGGEVGFVSRIFHESRLAQHKHRIKWYTSMLGKLSSVTAMIELLRTHNCHNYAVSEFIQGQKTRRWCIAWSHGDLRPAIALARGTNAIEKRLLPCSTSFEIPTSGTSTNEEMGAYIREQIAAVGGGLDYEHASGIGVSPQGDVWSRRARRHRKMIGIIKKQQQQQQQEKDQKATREAAEEEEADSDKLNNETSIFVFRITLKPHSPNTISDRHARPDRNERIIAVRWLRGRDAKTFESFCGWLKRKIDG